jgi:hypothetical protein
LRINFGRAQKERLVEFASVTQHKRIGGTHGA